MKLIIAGSRPPVDIRKDRKALGGWCAKNLHHVEDAVYQSGFLENGFGGYSEPSEVVTEVVSGKAQGFDTLGEAWAKKNHIPVKPFYASWNQYGKSAGAIRNSEMAKYADALIAITSGTPGTAHMVKLMKKLGKPTFVLELQKEE
jgi:hypothetical protein